VVLPAETPLEIKAKVVIILLNLGAKHLVKVIIVPKPIFIWVTKIARIFVVWAIFYNGHFL
jgi:hypothetical protein